MSGKEPGSGGSDRRERRRNPAPDRKEVPATPDEVILRQDEPPSNQLDYDDRHDTRATNDVRTAMLYERLRREKRKDAWVRLGQWLVGFVVLFAVYLVAVVIMTRWLPLDMTPQAPGIVGAAFLAAGAGVIGGRAAWLRAYSWWSARRAEARR
ncbi:hypothetical protein GCM10010168_93370 [Actinoplanes ianthinogenes]|uniref:Uncharacterized protein n=1 Tax=Actinoplanes ianthinogenes TaxID=122358 RepID=A0ABM7LKI9_9ACTN|nr:hypothetical protein [Actinoplanes ianthinogenes]BCJ39790.1 hypothetical protein Aiant_04470 [Actinoplanes ianthinogenes]GGR59909.1 hypothetical protein GCM10010168_93370 [Actinoplanes ianthinogenes]